MVSVVVPVCNEQANLPELRTRLTAALGDHEFECILVDDGSADATAAMVRDFAREDPRFKLVSLSRNFGHQAAIVAGLTFARGACVAVMDGDLQDPPELIPDMVRVWRKGAEVVYGLRTARREGWFTRATAAIFYRIQSRLTKTPMPLDAGDFAVMDRRVVDVIVAIGERHPYVRGLRSWVGFRQVAFPYERDRRRRGARKYTVWKLLDLAVAGIVPFSVAPLRLAALAGAGISTLALAAGVVGLLGGMPVLASVLVAVTFLFGLQLLVIGLLGEYVGRALEEAQNRPIFVVDDVVGLDPTQTARERGSRAPATPASPQ